MSRLLLSAVLAACLSPLPAAVLPRPAGQIEFISHTGEKIRLSDLKGKVVVIEFLLTHCPSCKDNARLLSRLQNELGPKGLQVIGLAIDEGAGSKLRAFVTETGTNFPVGVYSSVAAREYMQIPIVVQMMMPQIAVVDRKGMIRDQHGATEAWMAPAVEEKNLRALLTKLLAEGAAPPSKAAPKKK